MGIGAALLAALFWAIATRMFSKLGKTLNPAGLNSVKSILAVLLLLLTLAGRSLLTGQSWINLQTPEFIFLAVSGVLGIGIGDTAYFGAINRLGPRQTLVLDAAAPIMTTILAWIVLQERLTPMVFVGMAIATAGITWTLSEQTSAPLVDPSQSQPSFTVKLQGIGWGMLSALSQSSGVVVARRALVMGDVDPLESALVRLVAGSAAAVAIATLLRFKTPTSQPPPTPSTAIQSISIQQTFKNWRTNKAVFALGIQLLMATILGTYLGIWLQQTALKFTLAGVAQTCLATSPIFILPILYLSGERLSFRAIAGALVTVCGIILLVQN